MCMTSGGREVAMEGGRGGGGEEAVPEYKFVVVFFFGRENFANFTFHSQFVKIFLCEKFVRISLKIQLVLQLSYEVKLGVLIFLIRCVQYVELKVFAALTLVSLFLATVLLGRSVSGGMRQGGREGGRKG